MHKTSYLKMQAFFESVDHYLPPQSRGSILEIGSKSYHGQLSYKNLIDQSRFSYTGLDLEAGTNVDIVPGNPHNWSEIGNEQFDLVISGQALEHDKFFWVTFPEIARILKCGGILALIAPGTGPIHRFPVDCWRFYPDAWEGLCQWAGLELVETYYEEKKLDSYIEGYDWCDNLIIAKKPALNDKQKELFYERVRLIKLAASLIDNPADANTAPGYATQRYLELLKENSLPRQVLAVKKLLRRTKESRKYYLSLLKYFFGGVPGNVP